jgi:glycine/D-amino acid oxidase-like deaminating enzyme
VQYLSGDEARALEPLLSEDVLGAVCLPEASTADPHKTVTALTMEAREAGAVIHEHAPCLAIRQRPDGRYEACYGWQCRLVLALQLSG